MLKVRNVVCRYGEENGCRSRYEPGSRKAWSKETRERERKEKFRGDLRVEEKG